MPCLKRQNDEYADAVERHGTDCVYEAVNLGNSGMLNIGAHIVLVTALIPAIAYGEDFAPIALNSLSAGPENIASRLVMNQKGQILGHAIRIEDDRDGMPAALVFRADNGRTIVVSASATSYNGRIFITSGDQPQLAALSSKGKTAD